MKFRILMATATAASVLMTVGALADTNKLYIDQNGTSNAAEVDQTGSNNQAGKDTPALRIQQNGTSNTLEISQGSSAIAGLGGSYEQLNKGIDQIGFNNSLTITQDSGAVRSVQQTANTAPIAPNTSTNVASVYQHGASNTGLLVTRIVQTHGGGAANTVTIDQSAGSYQVSTVGLTNGQFRYDYANYFATALTGDQAGSHQIFGGVVQNGSGNSVDIGQVNANQQAGSVLQQGDGNAFYSRQSGGQYNKLTLSHSVGSDNDVDVIQTGQANNVFRIDQAGDSNVAYVRQVGTGNNVGTIDQNGTSNTATLDFNGSYNGASGFAAGFNDRGLVQGDVTQGLDGSSADNSLTYLVTGSSNLFAFKQEGSSNTIDGNVNGSSNQVAILQTGSSNVSSFTQGGSGNTVSALQ